MAGSEPPGVPTAAPRYPPFQGITTIRPWTDKPPCGGNYGWWCPSLLAKLVNTTPITMVYGRYIYTYYDL